MFASSFILQFATEHGWSAIVCKHTDWLLILSDIVSVSIGCRFEIHGMHSSDAMQIGFGAIAMRFWSRAIMKLIDALNEQRWFVAL